MCMLLILGRYMIHTRHPPFGGILCCTTQMQSGKNFVCFQPGPEGCSRRRQCGRTPSKASPRPLTVSGAVSVSLMDSVRTMSQPAAPRVSIIHSGPLPFLRLKWISLASPWKPILLASSHPSTRRRVQTSVVDVDDLGQPCPLPDRILCLLYLLRYPLLHQGLYLLLSMIQSQYRAVTVAMTITKSVKY